MQEWPPSTNRHTDCFGDDVYWRGGGAVQFLVWVFVIGDRGDGLMSDSLVIAGRAFASRLIVGTGKYRSFGEMQRAHEASGADMVTVAVRRVNLTDRSKESLLD